MVLILLMEIYNKYSTFQANRRKDKQIKGQPLDDVQATLKDHAEMLATDKRRIDRLERDVADVRDGQKALVKGVQALLEHELHNGNSEQMEKASTGLNEWLVNGR